MNRFPKKGLLMLTGLVVAFVLFMPGFWGGDTRVPLVLLLFYKYAGTSVIRLDCPVDIALSTGQEKNRVLNPGATNLRLEYGENKFRLLCPETKKWRPIGAFFSKNRNCSYEVTLRCRGNRDSDLECGFERRVQWGISWLLACDAGRVVRIATQPCMGTPPEEDEDSEDVQATPPNKEQL